MKKPAFWAVLFLILAVAGAAITFLGGRGAGEVAVITVDGQLYDRIDLSAVAVPYERTVHTENGWNTLRISHGSVQVVEADCPGQDCVRQGAISDGIIPIVCLPHKLVIEIEKTDE